MLFAIHCLDKPDHQAVRAANRDAHLAYLGTLGDRVLAAGPTMTDDGAAMTGSLLIIDFDDRAAADRFVADDPYTKAELFERVDISRWRRVLPKD